MLSIGNAVAAGALGIYRGEQGLQAFLLDHTVGQGTTAVGTVVAIVHLAGGARFEAGLSRGSNAFIYSGARKTVPSNARGLSLGNVIGVKLKSSQLRTISGKELLRHELVHNWQYRRGGLLSLGRLGLEQAGRAITDGRWDPYDRPGNLEYEARNIADKGLRPWYFGNLDDRFF